MDEEWANTNFPSFQTLSPRVHHPRTTNFGATHIEHSLSRPIGAASTGRYGSSVPPPATMSTLNTAHNLHLLRNNGPLVQNPLVPQNCPHHFLSVDFFPNPNGKKRHNEIDSSNSDSRHKRMIKNRDAAARSRARKHAYTDELELEVAYLLEENARLRKQQKKLCLAATQQPEKRNFCRANSAPL